MVYRPKNEKLALDSQLSTDLSNFDKRWSDAHFVSFSYLITTVRRKGKNIARYGVQKFQMQFQKGISSINHANNLGHRLES